MSLRHARDFFELHDAAGQADIGLDDVGSLFGENLAEIEFRVEALAGGERDLDLLFQGGQRVDVLHADRLFDPEGAGRLERLA